LNHLFKRQYLSTFASGQPICCKHLKYWERLHSASEGYQSNCDLLEPIFTVINVGIYNGKQGSNGPEL